MAASARAAGWSAGRGAAAGRGVTFHFFSRIASLMWAVRAMTFLYSV
jgi:hypothetical protein